MYQLAKFGSHRSYGNGDFNSCINSYMNILEKAELTASKSGIPFTIPKFLTRLAEKREEEEEHRQLQSVMCSTHTQKWERIFVNKLQIYFSAVMFFEST